MSIKTDRDTDLAKLFQMLFFRKVSGPCEGKGKEWGRLKGQMYGNPK